MLTLSLVLSVADSALGSPTNVYTSHYWLLKLYIKWGYIPYIKEKS